MARAVFTGHEVLTFMDYLDAGTGRTLVAVPGGTYDIIPASSGRPLDDIPAGWFVPVREKATPKAAKAEEEPEGSGE